jgi:hypothetical protein
MLSLRKPGRGPLARATARALIAALLLGLLPSHTIASTTSPAVPARLYLGNFQRPLLRVAGEVLPRMAVVAWGPAILAKSAFGELLAHTGQDPQPYAFTGEPLDPNSGFQYHRARWMDPSVGRLASMIRSRAVPSIRRASIAISTRPPNQSAESTQADESTASSRCLWRVGFSPASQQPA